MGIDAVAMLRIPGLVAPKNSLGLAPGVEHRGSASLINTMIRFDELAPDEHAYHLRRSLGALLDQHDDPRGIFLFPDVCEPKSQDYEQIVNELAQVGVWAPVAPLDHIPLKYTNAPAGTHEALVLSLIRALGRDTALDLESMAA